MDLLSQVEANLAARKVSIEEFSESEEFCGKRLYPRQRVLLKLIFLEELTGKEEDVLNYWIKGGRNGGEITISPLIRERTQYLREHGYSHFREVVLVGGRRSSKGFITGICLAKKMFDVLQLQDPDLHYQIDPDKEIYFSCVAASQDQAKKFQYADFSSTVRRCLAMTPAITKVQELEFSLATEADRRRITQLKTENPNSKLSRDISRLRGVALAANASTIRGSATIAIVMDEMAHMMQEGDSASTAEMVYDAAIPSLAQFGKDAMIFANSSPYTKLGKFYERYTEALKVTEEGKPAAPLMFGFQFPSWALFEGWDKDPLRRFRKAITVSPDWNEDGAGSPEDRDAILIAREEERQEPEKFKVERRGKFAEVIDAYLRPEMVDRAFLGRPYIESGRVMYHEMKTNWSDSSYMYRYYAHLDPSSTTAGFGFALGHAEIFEDENGNARHHAILDIIKRWNPQDFTDRVINWEAVLDEVLGFALLFEPVQISFDQFQNQAPMQWLRRELGRQGRSHIRVIEKTATAQHNWQRAEVFRTALYQGLVHAPNDTADTRYANLELKYLQQINTSGRYPRVDKQDVGPVQTKDMADCIMEVTDACIGDLIAEEMRKSLGESPLMGAPGGYSIGGRSISGGSLPPEWSDFYSKRKGEQKVFGARSRLEQLNDPSRRRSWSGRRRRRY